MQDVPLYTSLLTAQQWFRLGAAEGRGSRRWHRLAVGDFGKYCSVCRKGTVASPWPRAAWKGKKGTDLAQAGSTSVVHRSWVRDRKRMRQHLDKSTAVSAASVGKCCFSTSLHSHLQPAGCDLSHQERSTVTEGSTIGNACPAQHLLVQRNASAVRSSTCHLRLRFCFSHTGT